MQLKEGYENSVVGVIPVDWFIRPLAKVAHIQTGVAKNSNTKISDPVSVHYLRVANVQDGYLDLSDMSEITISRSDLRRFLVLPGDVLMNEGGDRDKLGRGAIWAGQFSPCVHQNHVFAVRCRKELSPKFLNAWTRSSYARQYFVTAGSQTTNLASINKSSLGNLSILLPPTLAEQEAIAGALSDADAWIESLEQLIAKKRQIKQGAMQELLTGKRRLPGFSGEWRFVPISRIAEITTGNKNTQDQAPDGAFPFFVRSQKVERINSYSFDGEAVLTAGDGVGTGKVFHYINGKFDAHQRVYRISNFHAEVNGYFFFLYFSTHFYDRIMQMTAKSSVDSVRREMIADMLFPITPTKAEQDAVASILTEITNEISAIESKLAKARQIKQAMMQELLTGRIRLVEPRAPEVPNQEAAHA